MKTSGPSWTWTKPKPLDVIDIGPSMVCVLVLEVRFSFALVDMLISSVSKMGGDGKRAARFTRCGGVAKF
jgi:hypothetical protein